MSVTNTNPLRHVQFFRNANAYNSLEEAINGLKNQLAGLKDGELVIGRYSVTSTVGGVEQTDYHAVLGVARVDGDNKSMDFFSCQDEQERLINDLNATNIHSMTQSTDANGNVTLTFKGTSETHGIIKQGDGTETLVLKKVATTGKAEDVALDIPTDGWKTLTYTAAQGETAASGTDDVQTAIEQLDSAIDNAKLHLYKGTATAETVTADGNEYILRQGGSNSDTGTIVAKFNIEKDSFVSDGSVVRGSMNDDNEFTPSDDGEYYIKLDIRTTDTQDGNTNEKTIYIPAESLVDTYNGDTYITVDNTTNTIKHTTNAENATNQTATSTIEFTSTELSKTLVVPSMTIDAAGHVTAKTDTTYTITLPSSIASAVQTVVGDETTQDQRDNLNNLKYVNVKAIRTDNDIKLQSSVKTHDIATAIATATSPWTMIADNALVEGYGYYFSESDVIAKLNESGIDSVTVDETTLWIYNPEQEGFWTENCVGKIKSTYKPTIGEDGLAVASDVKNYVDTHEPIVAAGANVTVTKTTETNGRNTYTVSAGLAAIENGVTNTTATDSYADDSTTHSRLSSITVDDYGRVTAYTTTTVTEDWDCGTF